MSELQMVVAYVAPMATIAAAAWRLSARLTAMDKKLEQLEQENQQLRAEVSALRTLMSVIVDSNRNVGHTRAV